MFLEGQDTPMIVRKQDGAFLYATTDLATIHYRVEELAPDAILYVVDHRQSLHFEQLFAAARLWGLRGSDRAGARQLRHRAGRRRPAVQNPLGRHGRACEGLLDEAVRRAARDRQRQRRREARTAPSFRPSARQQIAEAVGIGALKYADLSQNRTSDYVFSYDKMLAMNGNTATYMQYAYARVRSIFAKGNVDVDALRASGAAIDLSDPGRTGPGDRAVAILRSPSPDHQSSIAPISSPPTSSKWPTATPPSSSNARC